MRTAIASVVVIALSFAAAPAVAQMPSARLVDDAPALRIIDHPVDNNTVARRRPIRFDASGLDAIRAGANLTLNLFPNVSLPVLAGRAWQSDADTWHWQGHVPGDQAGSVIFVLHKGALWGSISARGVGNFRIRSHQNLGQVVEEIVETNFAPCGCTRAQAVEGRPQFLQPRGPWIPPANDGGLSGASECTGPIIDVMVLYTAQARDLEGGVEQIEGIALGLEDATNVTYINSLVTQRIRIVHVGLIDYVESGNFGTELTRLTDPADGFMDDAHALRDQYGADLVDLLISHTQGGTICGIAWLMSNTDINQSFAQYGFSVTNTGCAQGGYTFQHELGHNMGCHHDHDNAGGSPAFPWSYGNRFTGNDTVLYRTVMSYAPGTRIPYFSNPDVTYQGVATGVPQGIPDTQADNASTLNATASTVASFRAPPLPLGAPPSWPPPVMLSPLDPDAGDHFGISLGISGQLAIVGSYTDDQAGADAGAAYIFRFNPGSGVWEQEQKLIAPDAGAGDRFGVSVGIIDGTASDVAIVGAYFDDDGGPDAGSAYVFRRTGSTGPWVFEAKLTAADAFAGDNFGRQVSMAATTSGEVAIVGSPNDDDAGVNTGSAYIFRKSGATPWTQEQKLHAADPAPNDNFGQAVDIGFAPDSSQWAIVGSWHDDDAGTDSGSAYVFHRTGSWVQAAKLVGLDAALQDQAGFAVALGFPDASTRLAYVGSWKSDAPASNTGAVYVFADTGTGFAQETKLVPNDAQAEASFGVALDASADELIVGAYTDDNGALDAGAAYIFRRSGTSWTQETKLGETTPFANDQFGFAVAIDGARALAGAWMRDQPAVDSGAVFISGGGGGGFVDCNNNGIPDSCDIATGTSLDTNANGIPDECEPPPPCPSDIAPPGGNGVTDVNDLLVVITHWGPCPFPPPCAGDIVVSGNVDVNDLLAVISHWGVCPPP